MIIIFGTTNNRKIEDLQNLINQLNLDIEVKSLSDIGWDRGEIEETGSSLEENSLIKAQAISNFCKDNNIKYPILTDDAGLYVESLNGEPGIYTGRYADKELKEDPTLPKHESINKLLRKLNGVENRNAYYRCIVTCMYSNGEYIQEEGISKGKITESITEPIKKPYFYSIFQLLNNDKTFNLLNEDELKDTYRYQALKKVLKKIKKYTQEEIKELTESKKITAKDLIDSGICPTCYDKENNNIIYGDNTNRIIYENEDIECFLVSNPRADGHIVISSKKHYKDMMEIDDELCQKVFVFAKKMMNIIKEVYKSESVYLCTMCDGKMNHFHIQLIPRYEYEKRGSINFVKSRFNYIEDKQKIAELKLKLNKKL